MILTLVACGSKPSDNNNNTDSTAFPTKTMTIVCPYGAGGGTDLALRILAECGKDTFGQTINVENKTGGSGTVGLTEALNAAADGYTLSTCSVDLITLPLLGLAPAETTRDAFDPICVINGEPAAIEKVDNGMMAVYVPAGKNEIEFTYHTPGLKVSAIVSVAGIAAYGIYLLILRKRAKRQQV